MATAHFLLIAASVIAIWGVLLYLVWRFYEPASPMEVAQDFARWKHRTNSPLTTFEEFAARDDEGPRNLFSKRDLAWMTSALAFFMLCGAAASWFGVGA